MMSKSARPNVYIVRAAGGEVEVFTSLNDARQYARVKRGATVLERPMRRTLSEATVVYERRLHIVEGRVRVDKTDEELFFTVGADSGIPFADVESFETKDEQWTIVGLGTDQSRVDELVAEEINRLSAALA